MGVARVGRSEWEANGQMDREGDGGQMDSLLSSLNPLLPAQLTVTVASSPSGT